MTAQPILWGASTVDTPAIMNPAGGLSGLGAGGFALYGPVDNTGNLYQHAWLDLALGAAITAGASSQGFSVTLIPTLDGTNYPSPPGNTAQATGQAPSGTVGALPSLNFLRGSTARFEIPPFKFLILVQNNTGVALGSSGTFSLKLYRFSETVGT